MNITVTAYDRNGREIQEGDIIENDYGVRTIIEFSPKLRQYIAYDEAPFPVTLSEADIARSFAVVGNITDTPNFKPRYEAEIFYAHRAVERKIAQEKSFFNRLKKFIFD